MQMISGKRKKCERKMNGKLTDDDDADNETNDSVKMATVVETMTGITLTMRIESLTKY